MLSRHSLLSRPYRYFYILYDFIHGRSFELGFSGVKVPFDYMGNPHKFYTPDQFTTSHDIHDAISWMKTTDIFFKHKEDIYPLEAIHMPDEYENGIVSDIRHALVGVSILTKLVTGNDSISYQDIVNNTDIITKKQVEVSNNKLIQVDVNVSEMIVNILNSNMFKPLLRNDIIYACNFVNTKNVSGNLDSLISRDKYKIKLVVGDNRGITKDDVKLFEFINGNLKEIKLGHRTK